MLASKRARQKIERQLSKLYIQSTRQKKDEKTRATITKQFLNTVDKEEELFDMVRGKGSLFLPVAEWVYH